MILIKLKLRSQSGASITFALLLFLVCAVVCSVIIASATASAGRMSNIVKNDQQYYSVTSASELLKNLLNKVSIVKVTKKEITTTFYDSAWAGDSIKETYITYLVPDKEKNDLRGLSQSQILAFPGVQKVDATNFNELLSFSSIQNEAAYTFYKNKTIPEAVNGDPRILSLTSSLQPPLGSDADPLAVKIEEKMTNDGQITLTVGNQYIQMQQFDCALDPLTAHTFYKYLAPESTGYGPVKGFEELPDPEDPTNPDRMHSRYYREKTEIWIEIQSLTWRLKK